MLAERQAPVAETRRGRRLATVVAAVVVLAGAGVAGVLALRPAPSTADPTPTSSPTPILRAVPAPVELKGRVIGDEAIFTWTNPEPQDGDQFAWALLDAAGVAGQTVLVTDATVTVPYQGSDDVCIEVSTVRADRRQSETVRGCAER